MGGLMILAGVLVGTLLWADLTNPYVWVVIGVTASYGVLGFLDDYAKVTKQTTAGVSSQAKIVVQFAIAAAATFAIVRIAQISPSTELSTSVAFPVFKDLMLDLGWFYVAFGMVTIAGFSNAVNLTDGLDGLAIVPVMIAAAAFGLITYLVGNVKFADYLQVHFVLGLGRALDHLRRADRRGAGLPLVQRPAGQDLHGRHRLAGARRRARLDGRGHQA